MSRITAWGIRCLAFAIAFTSTANAQQLPAGRAPVPRQVLNARTVFIGNGGSESYGADSYYHLTKFDGGPDRAYNSFYAAVKEWGHYDLVGTTDVADLLLVIRFTNPVVDRSNLIASGDQPHDWVYDPQLNVSMNDPRTGLPLWAITEHIEPSDDRAVANRHFDEAVTRLVADLQRLILNPDAPVAQTPPPGAIAAAEKYQRGKHAGIGMLLGAAVGTYVGSRSVNDACTDFNNLEGCYSRGVSRGRNILIGGVAGAIAGSLIGWVWPTSVEGLPGVEVRY
jgi:hypothetical protein